MAGSAGSPRSSIIRPGDPGYDPRGNVSGVLNGVGSSSVFPTFPASGAIMQGQPSVGAFEPNLPPNMQGQSFSYGPDAQGGNLQSKNGFGDTFDANPLQPNIVTNAPDAGTPDWIKAMGGTLADGNINPDSGIGVMQAPIDPRGGSGMQAVLSNSSGEPHAVPLPGPGISAAGLAALNSGKGGTSTATPAPAGAQPATPAPQYAPVAPQQQGFNVNQASASALQGALGSTQRAMQGPLNIGAYANPYTSAVIDRTQQDIERQRQMAMNTLGAQATAANAFGGSRQGVAEGVMAGEYGRMAGDIAAQQRQANYSQALQAAMADRQARLGAASQLGGLGQQAFQTGQTIQQQQQQAGLLQQGIQQALIDAAKQQYAGYTGAPQQALQAPLAALGVTPTPQTTTNSMQPGLYSYLQLGANVMGAK